MVSQPGKKLPAPAVMSQSLNIILFYVCAELDPGLSPAATTVAFDRSVPPARVPVTAGPADDPDRGPYLLAFSDDDACQKSWSHSEGLFYERCQVPRPYNN